MTSWAGWSLALAVWLGAPSCAGGTDSPSQTGSDVKKVIRLIPGPVGGAFQALSEELARRYAVVFPTMQFQLVERQLPDTIAQMIDRGDADLGITLATALNVDAAGRDTGADALRVRAVSLLDLTLLHLVVRADSPIRRFQDLRGQTMRVAMSNGEGRLLNEWVLDAAGLSGPLMRRAFVTQADAAARLLAGDVDALMYQLGAPAESITAATRAGARLVPLEGPAIESLLGLHGFLQLARIPARTYPHQDESIRTIGGATVLLCGAGLDEDLVYQLTRAFFEILPAAAAFGGLRYTSLEYAPATPVPLHAGAARYYRERQMFQ